MQLFFFSHFNLFGNEIMWEVLGLDLFRSVVGLAVRSDAENSYTTFDLVLG